MNDQIVFFSSTSTDATTLVYILVGIGFIVLVACISVYRYRRFKLFQEFSQELTLLELDEVEGNALTNIVKRYSLKEPVSVLFSLRLFDELATKEISRVLGSAGSAAQKQQFINLVYEIRKKTYYPELNPVSANPKQSPLKLVSEPNG